MLQQATDAYRRTHRTTASPRELEAAMLLAAAAQLQAATNPGAHGLLSAAISYNCKVWTILVASALRAESPLPTSLRQSIAELGLFVIERAARIVGTKGAPAEADAAILIDINRRIAAGLRPASGE